MGAAESWHRVERWLSVHGPALLARLPAGASGTALDEAESALGIPLPASARESLAIHDGADLYIYDGRSGYPVGRPMALKEIIAQHRRLVELFGDGSNDEWASPPPGVRPCWWNRAWVPVLSHVNGDATCIDLDPTSAGVRGQVFSWAHDGGPGKVYAADYAEVLAWFADDLEAGRYRVTVYSRGEPDLDWVEQPQPTPTPHVSGAASGIPMVQIPSRGPAGEPGRSAQEGILQVRASHGYCRIRIAKDEAIRRFAAWNGVAQIGPLESVTTDDPVQLACKQPQWREAVFISELGEWTLFNDLTGAFTLRPIAKWLELAGLDELVFVAYSADLEYAEVLILNRGAVEREFRWNADAPPGQNVDVGKLVSPHEPFQSWIEVARFADSDTWGFSSTGWLWRYDLHAGQASAADSGRDSTSP